MLTEELLHFIWKFRLYDAGQLTTTSGEKIEVVHPGVLNTNAGADFTNAKIKIGDTVWVGNVEIHIRADDWYVHQHHTDAAYNNTVLHVVYQTGKKSTIKQNGTEVPVLPVKDAISQHLLSRYNQLMQQKGFIACRELISASDKFIIHQTIERMVVERLQQKVVQIENILQRYENNWEQVLFIMLAKYMGASVNKEPMQLLAEKISVLTIAKHSSNFMKIEALLFGTAGMLQTDYSDEYSTELRKEFLYLKRLHQIKPLEDSLWKFLRLRPANFPTLRIAQLAGLLYRQQLSFSKLLDCTSVRDVEQLLNPQVSEYWKQHYQFEKPSTNVRSSLGESMKRVIIINAVVPLLFAYGKYKHEDTFCERALQFLEKCKPETNSIINQWKLLGIAAANSFDSQGLLQLKNEHCNKLNCLNCGIGLSILKQ